MKDTVILVEPKDSINVGSVARVMDNFGFNDLILVSPKDYSRDEATRSARWGSSVLEKIEIVHSLSEAVSPFKRVLAFSSRANKKHLPHAMSFSDFIRDELEAPHATGTALLFGPEDTGLTNEHLEVATHVIYIEANEQNPSLNLSHAAAVVLYPLMKIWSEGCCSDKKSNDLCPIGAMASLERLVAETCVISGFFNSNTPPEIPKTIAQIFRRSRLTQREVKILEGVFGAASRKMRQVD